MATETYTRVVEYRFCVCDTAIAITAFGEDWAIVEEVRKNGQEDTHMSGDLEKDENGKFAWNEGESQFVTYGSQALADAIREYLDTNGLPVETQQG